MDKSKVAFLILLILGLSTICVYQKLKLDEIDNFLEKENLRKIQLKELRESLNCKKFLKSKQKIFQKNENLKKEVLTIFEKLDMGKVYFRTLFQDCFEIKFSTDEEEKIFVVLSKLIRDLSGITLIDRVHIKNEEDILAATIKFRIFYPNEKLEKYVYIKKMTNESFTGIFNLKKKISYQLNGIYHYRTAYINGLPFYKGDSIGKYEIVEISDDFIVIKKGDEFTRITIDESW